MRTVPVNHSAGPLPDGCEPIRLISIGEPSLLVNASFPCAWRIAGMASAPAVLLNKARREIFMSLSLLLLDMLDCHFQRAGLFQRFDAGINSSQLDESTRIMAIPVK